MPEYKWVGDHPQDLHDGRMLAPGEVTELSDEDVRHPHNETLISDGGLIPIDEGAAHEAKLADRRVSRREDKAVSSRPAVEGETVQPDGGAE